MRTDSEQRDAGRRNGLDTDVRPAASTAGESRPPFQVWLAELPPEIRRAYETQDWDGVPVKWRDMIRAWTLRMADEAGRR